MRKVSATVIVKENMMYNVTVNYRGQHITLLHYDMNGEIKPYKYSSFLELYKSVLLLLKGNGFYCGSYDSFGSTWYDIMWVDIDNPTVINKYGLPL